jgi:hypothetical protein
MRATSVLTSKRCKGFTATYSLKPCLHVLADINFTSEELSHDARLEMSGWQPRPPLRKPASRFKSGGGIQPQPRECVGTHNILLTAINEHDKVDFR